MCAAHRRACHVAAQLLRRRHQLRARQGAPAAHRGGPRVPLPAARPGGCCSWRGGRRGGRSPQRPLHVAPVIKKIGVFCTHWWPLLYGV